MKARFKQLRLSTLSQTLSRAKGLAEVRRPKRGWLNAVRIALGLSLDDVAHQLLLTRSVVAAFEKAEAEDRITLASLRKTATAMGCDLVYVILPKGTLEEIKEAQVRDRVTRHVLATEHTMAIEDQAAGKVQKKIADETKRALQKD